MRYLSCLVLCTLVACNGGRQDPDPAPPPEQPNDAPPLQVPDDATIPFERRIEAISFLGDTLSEVPMDEAIRAQREEQFEEARLRWVADPTNIDAIIWAGRRAAYLGRYQEAILIYGLGIQQYPDDPRLFRHRGHRYITTRQLDSAITDLERAAALVANQPDEVEPDGLPNPQNIPTSTLQSNIWYHLGLARFLEGDYPAALEAYRASLALSSNRDMEVASRYWLYLTLTRLGELEEASAVVAAVDPEWPIIENATYQRLLLLYRGLLPVEDLRPPTSDSLSVGEVTRAFGVVQWYRSAGDPVMADELVQAILTSGQWPAFGYIAAEADVARAQDGALEP